MKIRDGNLIFYSDSRLPLGPAVVCLENMSLHRHIFLPSPTKLRKLFSSMFARVQLHDHNFSPSYETCMDYSVCIDMETINFWKTAQLQFGGHPYDSKRLERILMKFSSKLQKKV